MSTIKPLILLDVDGVINDLGSLSGLSRPWAVEIVRSHGFALHVPDFMPGLIRWLTSVAEVHWCTTWRSNANDELIDHLGIDRLPVVDDGTRVRHVGWKAAAAYDLAAEALTGGRRVIWIEDFYGDTPIDEMPDGVEYVDTGWRRDAVLTPDLLPAGLGWAAA